MKTFFTTIRQHQLRFVGFLIFYALVSVVISLCGVITQKITGDLSQAALSFDMEVFARFIAVMAAVTGVEILAAMLNALVTGRFAGAAGYRMRQYFARHFTRVRFSDFTRKNSGELLSVYTNDLPSAVHFVADGAIRFVSEALNVLIIFIYMASIQPVFTLIFFIMFPVLVVMQVAISAPIQKKALVMSEARARFNAVVNDSLQNIPTIVAYSLESVMEKRYLNAYQQYFNANKSYVHSLLALVMSGIVASLLPILFIFAAAGFSTIDGGMTLSEFIAFTSVSGTAGTWLAMLSQKLRDVRVSAASAQKLNQNLADAEETATEETTDGGPAPALPDPSTAVAFSHVSFAYQENKPALDDVSFSIPQGARVAVVGPSGSGKSTLLKLLLGLYAPGAGEIKVSGADITGIPPVTLRRRLAYVPQDSFMFPESIRENLSHARAGAAPVTDEILREACAGAGILDFIDGLPDGLDTVLSESAENISGGQRQRLAIARAYLQDAPIVLFDEATAALDPLTEADVLRSFRRLTEGKTVLMVAHRPAAIEACETIIMMENGKAAAAGAHAELLHNCPAYAALYQHMKEEARHA